MKLVKSGLPPLRCPFTHLIGSPLVIIEARLAACIVAILALIILSEVSYGLLLSADAANLCLHSLAVLLKLFTSSIGKDYICRCPLLDCLE